jgi:predicted Zn-dependent peptidase
VIDSADYSALSTRHSALRLANGVRAVLLPRPWSPSFALQLVVRAGSRHDGPYAGLAHLVEHLVFRAPGGLRVDLFAAVEGIGGEVSASTGRDSTTFEIVVAAPDAARALALLPALFRPPATDAASLAGERQVICQELRERTPPANTLWDLLLAALWGDNPLVRAPAGTPQGVLAAPAEAARALHARYYRAPRLLVAAAGACSPEAFAAAVEVGLGDLPPAPDEAAPAAPRARSDALSGVVPGGMTYLAVGVGTAGLEHADCPALRLLQVALGQGATSRLGRAVAARGLSAAVQAHYMPYLGAGAFAALAVVPAAEAEPVEALLADELCRLGREPPTAAALAAARTRYLGALHRRCESNLGLAGAAGEEALAGSDQPPLAHTLARAATLSADEVAAVAQRAFAAPPARARLN